MNHIQNEKAKKSILKKVSRIFMIVGASIFVLGFILQFMSIASLMGSTGFEEPTNYFVVIILGFILLFIGVIVGVLDSMKKVGEVQEGVTSFVKQTFMDVVSGRMQQPAEIYCKYCGTLLNENERECPNCGAGRTKN